MVKPGIGVKVALIGEQPVTGVSEKSTGGLVFTTTVLVMISSQKAVATVSCTLKLEELVKV